MPRKVYLFLFIFLQGAKTGGLVIEDNYRYNSVSTLEKARLDENIKIQRKI